MSLLEPVSATRLAMEQAFSEAGVVPRVEMEIALGRLAVIPVKGFPVMRQWYVVHRRDRRLPRITEAFQRFVVKEGARLIRRHEKALS